MPDDDLHRLVSRLKRLLTSVDGGRLVILVGAGMTVPAVPGVARLTRLAREFSDQAGQPRPRADLNEPVPHNTGVQQLRIAHYTEALRFIREVRGPDGLRAFLQQAILHARSEQTRPGPFDQPLAESEFAKLEQSNEGWRLTEGLTLLADLLSVHGGRVQKYLLTTNFDPLLEVALRRAGLRIGASYGVSGPHESMASLRHDRARWTVVHLHGNSENFSLHYPETIRQPHWGLEDWLANLLRGSHLLVLGYSGWDGLVQRTLTRHFGRDAEGKSEDSVEVLWTVYESPADHPHVDAKLAGFFDQYRVRGVTAYYGIDRDRLLRTLHEELAPGVGEDRHSFYRAVRNLSVEYGFGLSRIRPDIKPAFVFWPHRLRRPHLIHGVHALTAALLSKLDIPIELHLDDTDMSEPYAEQRAGEFIEAVNGWFDACGASRPPDIYRVSKLLRSGPTLDLSDRLWTLACELYSVTNSAFDALVATKVVTAEAEALAVAPTPAHRLLRPVYTWLALDDAIERHEARTGQVSTAVTLGGVDEQKMWDLWQARPYAAPVASIFVPRLEGPDGGDLWQYSELRREAPFGARDLERFLLRSASEGPAGLPLLRWFFTAANRLAVLASDGAIVGLRGPDLAPLSWREVSESLGDNPAECAYSLSEAIAAWFYHEESPNW